MKDNLRAVRNRIRGTLKVSKVTSALERMSAARVIQYQAALRAAAPYAAGLLEAASLVAKAAERAEGTVAADRAAGSTAPPVVLVLGGNRGLCGGYNARLLDGVRTVLDSLRGRNPSIVIVGRALFRRAGSLGVPVRRSVPQPPLDKTREVLDELFDELRAGVADGSVGAVHAVYARSETALEQHVKVLKLMPVSLADAQQLTQMAGQIDWEPLGLEPHVDTALYEPAPERLLRVILRESARAFLSVAFLHSAIAEHAARQGAMHRASENAGALVETLKMRYNRLRQESITTQVIEVAAGLGAHAER
jgi:F-type H+-transporting ATPase subunit gamma